MELNSPSISRDDAERSRTLWRLTETIHAVTYFHDECADAMTRLGLKGVWMGYFAARSAPLGACDPLIVESTFFNFAGHRVRRALPDAWTIADPGAVIEHRCVAAALALRDAVSDLDAQTERVLPLLESAVRATRPFGRILAAANLTLERRQDPVERLWSASTCLREFRGDGHVAALIAHNLSGIEAHCLRLCANSAPPSEHELLQQARGWTLDEWEVAHTGLISHGLVNPDRTISAKGEAIYGSIESVTDQLGWQPFADGLTSTGIDLLISLLTPVAAALDSSGLIPRPNPIGL